MYRDDRASAIARLEAASASRDAAARDVVEKLEAIEVLNGQLRKHGLATARPDCASPKSEAIVHEGMSLAELVSQADVLEQQAVSLGRDAALLSEFFVLLQDRLLGKPEKLALGAAPRRVPWTYALAEWVPRGWMAVLGFASTAILGEMVAPAWRGPAQALAVLGLVGIAGLRAYRRTRLLRWAKVARTTLVADEATSTENTNWPMRQAVGWDVRLTFHTGSTMKSRLRYLTDEGATGELTIRGPGYDGGVVLYDSSRGARPWLVPVQKLVCCPKPDMRGAWSGELPVRVWLRLAIELALLGYLVWWWVESLA